MTADVLRVAITGVRGFYVRGLSGPSNGGLTAHPGGARWGWESRIFGTEIAEAGRLDLRIIGDASRTGRYDQQDLKRVWRYLARFGSPDCTPLRTLPLMRAEPGVVLGDVLQRTGGAT